MGDPFSAGGSDTDYGDRLMAANFDKLDQSAPERSLRHGGGDEGKCRDLNEAQDVGRSAQRRRIHVQL